MGESRQRKRHRSNLVPEIPRTALQALKALGGKVPRPKLKRPSKGDPIPTRSRLTQWGKTAEEKLMELAPEGSQPERMVYGWLIRHGVPFEFQVPLMGGRVPGGAIVDFVLHLRETPLIIRIMGYWHDMPGQKTNDELQRDALEQVGWRIEDIWEYEINTEQKVRDKMVEILYGHPKPTGLGNGVKTERAVCPRCGDPDCTGGGESL